MKLWAEKYHHPSCSPGAPAPPDPCPFVGIVHPEADGVIVGYFEMTPITSRSPALMPKGILTVTGDVAVPIPAPTAPNATAITDTLQSCRVRFAWRP